MSRILEFIIRLRDDASAKLAAVRDTVRGTKEAAAEAKPGLEGMAGGLKDLTEGARNTRSALMGVLGAIGMAVAAAKVGWWIGKKLLEITGNDPDAEKRRQAGVLAQAERTDALIARFQDEEKERLAGINAQYERQIQDIDELAKKHEALAAARRKASDAAASADMDKIDAAERMALLQGWDPEAVRVMYGGERGLARAQGGIDNARQQIDAAAAAEESAQRRHALAVDQSIAYQDQINQAEATKADLRKKMNDLYRQSMTDEERLRKATSLTYQNRKADATIAQAERGLSGAEQGEALAKDAVEIAKAEAEAAAAAMEAALTARAKAEFDYQADVAEFFDRMEGDEREAAARQADAMRSEMAERKRLREEADAEAHASRVEDIRAEAAVSEAAEGAARDRLARARSAASTAWGWYRDPEAFRRQLAEEKADAEAQKRFGRDEESLRGRTNWRTRRLDDDQEAVRRVVLAREEERAASENLAKIERNTAGLNDMLKNLLTSR